MDEMDIEKGLSIDAHEFLMYGATLDLVRIGVRELSKNKYGSEDPDSLPVDATTLGFASVLLFIENRMKMHKKLASTTYELAYGVPLPEDDEKAFELLFDKHKLRIDKETSDEIFKRNV